MIAPIIAALLRRKTCTKSKYWRDEEEPYTSTLQDHKGNLQLTAACLATHASNTITIVKNSEIPVIVKNILFSSSRGAGKYRLIKNDVAIATLYSKNEELNIFYPFNVSIKVGDTLMAECLNTNMFAQDIHVGFDVEEV